MGRVRTVVSTRYDFAVKPNKQDQIKQLLENDNFLARDIEMVTHLTSSTHITLS